MSTALPLTRHEKLSADDKETVLTLADVMASAHKEAAEGMAASLAIVLTWAFLF
jgi:hypothetical protein